jgi:hypothetical protein
VLRPSLAELDRLAADPDDLDEGVADAALPPLRHALHAAAEWASLLQPPPPAEMAHARFADALALARDATAELEDALADGGPDAAAPLVWEWRGALFRVRYARLGLVEPQDAQPPPVRDALLPLALLLLGVAAVLGGALASEWPVWLGGLLLVGAGIAAGRGQP